MTADWLWTLPLVGAVVGYATNWLAVRMLFRPRKPVRVFGLTFLGLVPRRRGEIAASVAATVERELISPKDLQAIIRDEKLLSAIQVELEGRVAELLRRKIEELPMVAQLVVSDETESRLGKSIVKHAMAAIPEIADRLQGEIDERLDVRKIVEERMNAFDIERLEALVLEIARRELRAIELLGAVIGAAVGGAQWALLHFLA
jgi:uncharacterized membrane protein YheB (UPF0754 family)